MDGSAGLWSVGRRRLEVHPLSVSQSDHTEGGRRARESLV